MTHLYTDKNMPEYARNPKICHRTLRRSSLSEKLTLSWDNECPLLPFVETGEAKLFWRDADMNEREQVGQRFQCPEAANNKRVGSSYMLMGTETHSNV